MLHASRYPETVSWPDICSSLWGSKDGDVSFKEEAIAELRAILRPSATIFTEIVTNETETWPRETFVKLHVFEDNKPRDITRVAARAIGSRMNRSHDAIVTLQHIRAAEFAVVADLSVALFPDGFECIGKGCPSHEHPRGDSNYAPHLHKDGRNALRPFGLKYRHGT